MINYPLYLENCRVLTNESESVSHPVESGSLRPCGLYVAH